MPQQLIILCYFYYVYLCIQDIFFKYLTSLYKYVVLPKQNLYKNNFIFNIYYLNPYIYIKINIMIIF